MRRKGKKIRTRKKNRVRRYLILIMFVAFVVGISALAFNPSFYGPNQPKYDYVGKIINIQFADRSEGTVLEDRDCRSTGPNLTTCTAIIEADSSQELHFKYTHDMHAKRCLAPGDRVIVEASNSDEATVTLVK